MQRFVSVVGNEDCETLRTKRSRRNECSPYLPRYAWKHLDALVLLKRRRWKLFSLAKATPNVERYIEKDCLGSTVAIEHAPGEDAGWKCHLPRRASQPLASWDISREGRAQLA